MKKKVKHYFVQIFKIALSVGIIWWLVATDRLNLVALKNLLEPTTALICLFLMGLNVLLTSERWRLLTKTQGIQSTSWEVFKLTNIGLFFNFAMPGGVGGDIIKAYYFSKDHPHAKAAAITSVVMDRALGLYAMILMALVVMVYDLEHVKSIPALLNLFYFMALLSFAFTVSLFVVFSRKVHKSGLIQNLINPLPLSQKLLKLYNTAHRYGSDRIAIIKVLALSLAAQTFSILLLYTAGEASNIFHTSVATYFLVAPLGFMATAIPISPAGVGVGQAAFLFLFNIYIGKETNLGPTVITAFQVFSVIYGLVGAVFYMQHKGKVSINDIEKESLQGE